VRTEAQWLQQDERGSTLLPVSGTTFNRGVYFDLVNQLGRTELTEWNIQE
jgi:hypothetical protein